MPLPDLALGERVPLRLVRRADRDQRRVPDRLLHVRARQLHEDDPEVAERGGPGRRRGRRCASTSGSSCRSASPRSPRSRRSSSRSSTTTSSGPLILAPSGDKRPITAALNNLQGQFFTDNNLLAAGALLIALPTLMVFVAAPEAVRQRADPRGEQGMTRIAFIGAGSVVFTKNLLGDILALPGAARGRDRAPRHRPGPARRPPRRWRATSPASAARVPTISAHLDRRAALDGADFVLNMVQIGGHEATLRDFEIPARYGLRQTIARHARHRRDLPHAPHGRRTCSRSGHEMAELCPPGAWLLNYTNPMAMLCQLVYQGTPTQQRRRALPLGPVHGRGAVPSSSACPQNEVTFLSAGVNHQAFLLRFERDGEDLYPRLDERIAADPELQRRVRVALYRAPRLLPDRVERARRRVRALVHGPRRRARALPHPGRRVHPPQRGEPRRVRAGQGGARAWRARCRSSARTSTPRRSSTRWSPASRASSTGTSRNTGLIPALPEGTCVEVPCLVDHTGVRPTPVLDYPPAARSAEPDLRRTSSS